MAETKLEKAWNWLLKVFVPDKPTIPSRQRKIDEEVYTAYLTGYVTRDKSGKLQLHSHMPGRFKLFGEWTQGLANLNPGHFPELTWEHEALEVLIEVKSKP